MNVECKDTQTSVWSSQYNIDVAIKLSEAYTNKMRVIARCFNIIVFLSCPVNVFFYPALVLFE